MLNLISNLTVALSIITLVFPIRGREYWRQGKEIEQLDSITKLVQQRNLPATWLIHYDVLEDQQIIDRLKDLPKNQEIGVFSEVTRKLADDSHVYYDWVNGPWTSANKLFFSGYRREDRKVLIDQLFNKFKDTFGYYPKSYGSWYTDVYSTEYIRDKYGASIQLGLADQYSTDGYQTWGQIFDQPYFISQQSAIEPATKDDNTNVVKIQWAPRHPIRSYGNSVDFSNYSAQVNDYYRYHHLGTQYFTQLLKDINLNVQGPISQTTIGIEISELEPIYSKGLSDQLDVVKNFSDSKKSEIMTMSDFGELYRKNFDSTPKTIINSQYEGRTVRWINDPQYRSMTTSDSDGEFITDLRYYHQSPLRDNDQLVPDNNTNLTRMVAAVIDDVVYKNKISLTSTIPSPRPILPPSPTCSDPYGNFKNFPCLYRLLTQVQKFIPDLRYSYINRNYYLGVRINKETLLGLSFPKISLGRFTFSPQILDNFINLDKYRYYNFPLFGRQESELGTIGVGESVVRKFTPYGQEHILKLPQNGKIFENSYYTVYKNEK